MTTLPAPFPWFGGKRRVAKPVWARFGAVKNYVEPFFGSGAVLLGRPPPISGNETVNDLDGFVANFWRSIKHSPEETARWADNPVNENDLHARHIWLIQQRDILVPRLEGDANFHDPQIAGWWAWGLACWIGSGFCSGDGPWQVDVNQQLARLGNNGQGVNRKRVHLGNNGQGRLSLWFEALAARMNTVRVCSGDWSRVCGPSVTFKHGLTAVFLDPPYGESTRRTQNLYRQDNMTSLACEVREWAIENGKRDDMRIALCGYEGEHQMPSNWSEYIWNAGAGYGGQAKTRTGNGKRERIWFSPSCLQVDDELNPRIETRRRKPRANSQAEGGRPI